MFKKKNKRLLWTTIYRRTRKIVAYVIGDRSEETCRQLWQGIPDTYKHCQTYSDFWDAYANVFLEESHQRVGKDSGQTNPWNAGTTPCDNGMPVIL